MVESERVDQAARRGMKQPPGWHRSSRPVPHRRALQLWLGSHSRHHRAVKKAGQSGGAHADGARSSAPRSRRSTTVLSRGLTASTAAKGTARRRLGSRPRRRTTISSGRSAWLVADVVEPAEARAVACHHLVPLGGGEQATELRLPPQALLGTLIPDPLAHRTEA